MPLQIIGDAGQVCVDDNYYNPAVQEIRTLTASLAYSRSGFSATSGLGMVVTTVSAESPIFALNSDAYAGFDRIQRNSDGSYTLTIVTEGVGSVVKLVIYSRPTGSGSFGFQAFSNGNLVFDAFAKYLQYDGGVTNTAGLLNETTLGLIGGRTYAAVVAVPGVYMVAAPRPPVPGGTRDILQTYYIPMTRCVSGAILYKHAVIRSGLVTGNTTSYPPFSAVNGSPSFTLFGADITGY